MKETMWKTIKDTTYHINVSIDRKYNVLITDFVKIWSCSFTENSFVECLIMSNEGLEMDRKELLDKGTEILSSPEKLSLAHIHICDSFLIACLGLNYGYCLSVDMNLQEGSSELFFQKVTQPLFKIVQDLRESENELRKLVATKDEEITEYKTQGGKIKYTALKPYNDTDHMNRHQCYNNFFNSIRDPQSVLNKTIECPASTPDIKEEPVDSKAIKDEPLSEIVDTSAASNLVPDVTTTLKVVPNTAQSTIKVEVKEERKSFIPKKKRLNL